MHQRSLTADDLDRLRQVPLFAPFETKHLSELFSGGTVRSFEAPTLLFSAGEPADCFYAVLGGEVHLLTLTAEGAQGLVTIVGPGESFAEAAMFGLGVFPVNGEAQTGAELVRVDKGLFERFLRQHPNLTFRMLDAMLSRQHFLITEIHRLKAQTPSQRLASYLLTLSETTEWKGRGRLPLHKHLIASRIGIDPASLSRALRRLGAAGISCPGDEVVIEDLDKLRDYCAAFEAGNLVSGC